MCELLNLSIVEVLEYIKNGEFTVKELVISYLDRINKINKKNNAFITITHDFALKRAEISDRNIQKGQMGIIEGIPIAVKDLFCTNNIKTTAGSKMLSNFIPSYDSTIISLLYKHGGILIGKTNMDEFAMGSSNKTSYFGNVKNPWKRNYDNLELVPGGSSGGSAVAIATF